MAQTWPLTLSSGSGFTPSTPPSKRPTGYERLTVQVTHADGRVSRWAGDEPDPANVPAGLGFQTAIPGGYTSCTLTLPRSITRDYPDLSLFDDVKVLAPGGQVRWHGYVSRLPREHADQPRVSVECVGWSGALKWDQSFREIYVDHDKSGWGGPTPARIAEALGDGYREHAPQGTTLMIDIAATAGALPFSEAWYDSGGIPIGSLYYSWLNTNANVSDPDWYWWARFVSGPTLADGYDTGSNLRTGAATGTETPATAGRTHVALQHFYNTTIPSPSDPPLQATIDFQVAAVYGAHGLTKRGVGTATDAPGFFASDIIENVVARQCPFMRRNITPTSFVVPQAAFKSPTDADTVTAAVNAYHLFEYGCWTAHDGAPEFFYRMPTDELVWEARLDQGAELSPEGDDATGWWNGVVVSYQDNYGRDRVAGPTGSGADVTSDSLLDQSEGNPVNAHGLGRKWANLGLSSPTTSTGAVQIGAAWLTEQNLPQRRGAITLAGTVNHPTEGAVPVTRVRAGDWIRVADKPGDVARRIVSTSYQHPGQLTCDVGGMPARVEAILERIGVALLGRV